METLFLFFIGGGIGVGVAVFSVESVADLIIKSDGWFKADAIISFNVIVISIVFYYYYRFNFWLITRNKSL